MLKRITKIKNIGKFKDVSCGSFAFDKITLMYGMNSYGKSTLGDIFASFERGNIDSILKGRSIPLEGTTQNAVLCFEGMSPGEIQVKLGVNGWDTNLPDSFTFHVFDDSFYHESDVALR